MNLVLLIISCISLLFSIGVLLLLLTGNISLHKHYDEQIAKISKHLSCVNGNVMQSLCLLITNERRSLEVVMSDAEENEDYEMCNDIKNQLLTLKQTEKELHAYLDELNKAINNE